MDLATLLVLLLGLVLGAAAGGAAGLAIGQLRALRRDDADPAEPLLAEHHAVRERLERLQDQLQDLQHERASWQGQLHQQVGDVVRHTDLLRRETHQLVSALRRPQVRGQWGELHLRRAVELAGMVAHCDFTEQVRLDDGARRPDLVVHLAGGRSVVVDAKVPLDAYLDAIQVDDGRVDDARLLRQHAERVRAHVDLLGSKGYWRGLRDTPEFVVLFLPAEPFLGAALEADPGLLEHAAARQVVLATPSTLIALLRTVAYGWRHEALTAQAAEIAQLGGELHERLGSFRQHLDRVGGSLNAAVTHYNQAVGSFERRVLVSSRRLAEAGVGEAPQPPRQVGLHAVEGAFVSRSEPSTDTRHAESGSDDDAPGDRTVAL